MDCLKEMLIKWLSSTSPPPTWSGLVQSLSSALVGEQRLAEEVREQYCHQDGEQATGPAPGEVCVYHNSREAEWQQKRKEREEFIQ